jgi:hypothetical protein
LHSTSHIIIAHLNKKRKPYFINKPLIKRKYYLRKEAVAIKRGCLYLTLILSFLLGTHEGFIALFQQGSKKPLKVYPYAVTSLPPADQKLLHRGIPITSREQLQHFLEDYLS